jgi:hypothetical protein
MALTLVQAAALSSNMLERGVMETVYTSGTILDRLPFGEIDGNAYSYNMEGALPASAFRAVNTGYTESTGTTTNATESLVILGGDADVDRFLQRTRSNLNDQRAIQTAMKAKSVSANFSNTFINGNTGTDANSFNGLKTRLTGGQVISMGTNGAAINTDNTVRHAFFDRLDELQSLVPNIDVFYTNAQVLAKFRSAARQTSSTQQTVDNIGRTVDAYNGIPIVDVGNKADGTAIIPQTETQGASSVASSIYAVSFADALGEPGVLGIQNGGMEVMDLGQLQTQPVFRTRIEWYCGVALFGPKPAARLTGVLAS